MTNADDVETEARITMQRIKELNKKVMPHKDKAAGIAYEKDDWWLRVKSLMVSE